MDSLHSTNIPRIDQEIVLAPTPMYTLPNGEAGLLPVVHTVDHIMRNSNDQHDLRAVRWALWWVTSQSHLNGALRRELDALWMHTASPRTVASETRAYVPLEDVVGVLRRYVMVTPAPSAPTHTCCPLWKLLCVERSRNPIIFRGTPTTASAADALAEAAAPVGADGADDASCADDPRALWVLMRAGVSGRKRPLGFVLNDTKKKRERLLQKIHGVRPQPRFRVLAAMPLGAPLTHEDMVLPAGRVMSVRAHMAAAAAGGTRAGPSQRTRLRRAAATQASAVVKAVAAAELELPSPVACEESGVAVGTVVAGAKRRAHECEAWWASSPRPVKCARACKDKAVVDVVEAPPALIKSAQLIKSEFAHLLHAAPKAEDSSHHHHHHHHLHHHHHVGSPSPLPSPTLSAVGAADCALCAAGCAAGDKGGALLDGLSNDSFGSPDWFARMLQPAGKGDVVSMVPTPPGSPGRLALSSPCVKPELGKDGGDSLFGSAWVKGESEPWAWGAAEQPGPAESHALVDDWLLHGV